VLAGLIRDLSLNLSFMFFVQAKAVAKAGICTAADRLRQLVLLAIIADQDYRTVMGATQQG
jgi:hypothetical protein